MIKCHQCSTKYRDEVNGRNLGPFCLTCMNRMPLMIRRELWYRPCPVDALKEAVTWWAQQGRVVSRYFPQFSVKQSDIVRLSK